MDKTKQKMPHPQVHNIPAGMYPHDAATELFGCRTTRRVYGISRGKTIAFAQLEPAKRAAIFEMMLLDATAMEHLQHLEHDQALEQYAFCLFGAADHIPDFDADGNLNAADNFICGSNCRCLAWKSKSITVDGHPLTHRQVQIITLMASDKPDKQIADELGISASTLDTHKSTIYSLFGVNSKAGMIVKAVEQKIIQ